MCVCLSVCHRERGRGVYVCVFECVSQRERENVCVCVFECVSQRERERCVCVCV